MRLVEQVKDYSYTIEEDVQGRPLRVGGEMQLADTPNLNRRRYPLALWNRVLESSKLKSRLAERRVVGHLDHPADGKTKLEWPGPSHVMTSMELRDSKRFPGTKAVYGIYECLPTPSGKVLEALLRSKIGIQVSSRGDGDLEESQDGVSTVIPESYEFETFDVVLDPSVSTDVRVMENRQAVPGVPGATTVKESCSCQLPKGATTEDIVKAIHGIVESGNLDRDCAAQYKKVLESALPNLDSDSYLMADEALSNLRESLEGKPVMDKPTIVAEAQTSGTTELARMTEAHATASRELTESNKQLNAAKALIDSLVVQSRGHKMRADFYEAKHKELAPVATRYESAKQVITKLREAVIGLQNEGKLRVAAEQLLGALLTKIDEAKKVTYVDRLLAKESVEVRGKLRPVLLNLESKSAVNRHLLAFKGALNDSRQARGLPPVNESGRRTARVVPHSPLMESRGRVVDGRVADEGKNKSGVKIAGQGLEEQVEFSRRVLKASR